MTIGDKYDGPFEPFDAERLECDTNGEVLAWRFTKTYPEPGRWEPNGYEVFCRWGVLTVDLNYVVVGDSSIYAP